MYHNLERGLTLINILDFVHLIMKKKRSCLSLITKSRLSSLKFIQQKVNPLIFFKANWIAAGDSSTHGPHKSNEGRKHEQDTELSPRCGPTSYNNNLRLPSSSKRRELFTQPGPSDAHLSHQRPTQSNCSNTTHLVTG